jgi:hypothetical protein
MSSKANRDDFMNIVREAMGLDPIPEKGRVRGSQTGEESDFRHVQNLARFEGDGNYMRRWFSGDGENGERKSPL